jgi:hypothetical protein
MKLSFPIAKNACGQYIYAYEDQLQPELRRLQSELGQNKNRGVALHSYLLRPSR